MLVKRSIKVGLPEREKQCPIGFPIKSEWLIMNDVAKKLLRWHACLELIPEFICVLFKGFG